MEVSVIQKSPILIRIEHNSNINFTGDGNDTISGGDANRVSFVNQGTVSFSNLTIADGLARGQDGQDGGGGAGMGGGLFVNSGAVTVKNFIFSKNQSIGGNGGNGSGAAGKIQLASLSMGLSLTNNDIFVVANSY